MTVHPEFLLRSQAAIPEVAYDAMRLVLRHEAQARDLKVLQDSGAGITVQMARGLVSFAPSEGGVSVTLKAAAPEWLQTLKERLVERLAQTAPQVADSLRWSGVDQAGEYPPNFRMAEILSIDPVGTAFLRVRAQAQNLASFQDDAIHFRLLLPVKNVESVEWPTLAPNESIVWPKGEKALHRPVYTVRTIDRPSGIFDFDVFLHEGGRVTEWARVVEPGTQCGMTGPNGGGIPQTNRILAYADETAFPAIARTLETLPRDTVGHVSLLAETGADCAYPITAPDGVSVTWHRRWDGVDFADLALTTHQEHPDYFLWFAGEKSEVLRVRAAYKDRHGDPAQSYIAAYWSRS